MTTRKTIWKGTAKESGEQSEEEEWRKEEREKEEARGTSARFEARIIGMLSAHRSQT